MDLNLFCYFGVEDKTSLLILTLLGTSKGFMKDLKGLDKTF